jgi:hypothetical protein
MTIAGQPAGDETFRLLARGPQKQIITRSTLKQGGGEIHVEATLVVDASYRPVGGEVKHTTGDKVRAMTLATEGGQLVVKTEGAEPLHEHEKDKPSALFVDSLVISHLMPMCVLGGDADKDVRIFPGIDLKLSGGQQVAFTTAGGKRELTYFKLANPNGNIVELLCDGTKLAIVRQGAIDLLAVRQGYEDVQAHVVKAANRKPDLPGTLQEVERSVRVSGGAVLACSLVMPAERRSPLPALVLLNGAGPQDRDADSPPGGPVKVAFMKHLAIVLGQSHVATLRCDDPGVGKSTGSLDKATLDTLVADGMAMLGTLRSEAGIDPARVGVLGHGEGASVASIIATRDNNLKALVMLGALGRTFDVATIEERDDDMRKAGVKAADIETEHKRFARLYDAVRAGKPLPADVSEDERKMLEPALPYLASLLRFDPIKALKPVKIPVFVGQGGKDDEATPKDAKLLMGGLAADKKATLKSYPTLSHFFTPVKTETNEDYADPTLAIDLAFLGDLSKWAEGAL